MYLWGCILLILLPALLHAENATERCGEPREELIVHGTKNIEDEIYLKIVCDSPGKSRFLHCNQNNQWTLLSDDTCPVPTCELSDLPPQEDNVVRVDPARNQLDDIVTYRCPHGLLGGPISFRCQKKTKKSGRISFHWKPQNRTNGTRLKELNCTEPEVKRCQYQNASHRVILDQDLTYGIHLIVEDDELTLGCTEGYELNGYSFVYCDIGGVWNPEVLPTCEKLLCMVPERPHLTARLDGTDTPLVPGINLTLNEKVAWQCDEGYTLRSSNGGALLTCNADWQRKIPSCEAVQCPHVNRPEHGSHILHNNPSLPGVRRVGSWVEAECDSGYTLHGTFRRLCTTAGSWDGILQVCDNGRSTCKNPGRPIGGRKVGDRYNRGNKVMFSCNPSHTLLGSVERECLDNGEWTGEETRCIGANEYMTKEEALMRLGNGLERMSEKSVDTKWQKNKLDDLMGKKVLLGKYNMEMMSKHQRTTIQELRDNGGLDVYFVLDTSGSIPKDHKNISVEITKMLVELVGVSAKKSGTGFGFLAFDSEVWNVKAIGEKKNITSVNDFLDGFRPLMFNRTGGTAPAAAFAKLNSLIQTRITYLKRNSMLNRASAIVLLSDGIKNEGGDPVTIRDKLINQSKLLGHEVHVYCIGVGNVNKQLLKLLASEGDDYLVYLQSLSDLKEVVSTIYNGNTTFGECGVQGHPDLYTGDISDVYATAGTWRWVGGLYWYPTDGPPSDMKTQLSSSQFICGVSLITKGPNRTQSEWALTAAHCLYAGKLINETKLLVKFGSLNSSTDPQNSTVVGVERFYIPYNNFSMNTMLRDIALLKLKVQLKFAYDIRPVCLHKPNEGHVKVNSMAIMTGWGWLSMKENNVSPALKQLSARIQSNESCANSTRNTESSKFQYPHNFCAGNVRANGKLLDACKLDSGSPLVICERDGLRNVCTQIGIVSYGDGCGQPGKYGVYTNITTYYYWIMNKMNNT